MKSIGEFVRDENFKKRKLSGDVSCILYSQDGKETAKYQSTHIYGDYSDKIYVHSSMHTEHHSEDIWFSFSKDLAPGSYPYYTDVVQFVCDARYGPAWQPKFGLFVLEKNSLEIVSGQFRFHKDSENEGLAVTDGKFHVNFATSAS